MSSRFAAKGFTLIEVMITVVIVAILATVAMPAYTAYITRSKIPEGLDSLNALATRLEQFFQDGNNNSYGNAGNTACGVSMPAGLKNFTVSCTLTGANGAGFSADAVGSGPLTGYTYRITSSGQRQTVSHPKAATTPIACWSMKGAGCDT